jgi:PKD domain
MALRRELLLVMVAAFLLLGPGRALAAPQWLPADPLTDAFVAPDNPAVATDADGNSIAVWIEDDAPGAVLVAYRPRGGPWETTTVDLEADFTVLTDISPRAVALPDGSFVVVWSADRTGVGGTVLRSATRSPAGVWTTEDVRDLTTTTIEGLEAGPDGSVMVLSLDEGATVSNTKPSPGAPWGPTQLVGIGGVSGVAIGPDGAAVAVSTGFCNESPCIRASRRPQGGDWGGQETVASTSGKTVVGLAVTANPDSSATAVWAVETFDGEVSRPPSDVLSADRTPGAAGSWSAEPDSVAHLETDTPNCDDLRCIDIATGTNGAQLTVWPQTGPSGDQIAAAVRSSGGDWTGPETVSGTVRGNNAPRAAITTSEVPVVAWSSSAANFANANASHRDVAGDWHPVLLDSSQDDSVSLGDLDADGDGNALTAFRHRGGVFAAGFDGAGPRFSTFSVPSGPATQPLAFAAAADDNWSAVDSIAWLFGDGTGAPGAAVSHAYGAPGGYTATATATDAVGNTTEQSGPVTVGAAPTPTPGPDPCGTTDKDKDGIKDGCDSNDGSKRPVAFKTVNATVVSGDVFVKLPAGAARVSQAAKPPKGFVRLEGAETIPVGSTLDTAKGRVSLRTASDTRKHVQTAQFFRGRFLIRQVRKPRGKAKKRSTKLITELRLAGSSFSKACKAKASISAKKRSKKRVRRLFGDGKGAFRTRGRNAAATVRGTRWSVQDRCDGTLVTVQRGRVEVRDLVKHKTVFVRTGHTYLARLR